MKPRRPSLISATSALASITFTLLSSQSAHAAAGTWTQSTAGTYNWSDIANWNSGAGPIADGATFNAAFNNVGGGNIITTLDTARTIGGISRGGTGTSTQANWTITDATNVLTLDNGGSNVTISNAVNAISVLTVDTDLLLNSNLVITANGNNNAAITFGSAVGGHTITGAKNITISSSSANGTGAITINSNISTTGSFTNTNTGTGGGGVTINGIIGSGVTGVTQNATNANSSMTLTGANLYTGATTIGAAGSAVSGKTLTVSGANGSIKLSSGYTINGIGSQLNLDYVGVANGAVDRIGNVAVTLNLGGELRMNGATAAGTSSSESFGTLTLGAGNGIVTINNGGSGTSTDTLTASGFFRGSNFATALVRGSSMGLSATLGTKLVLTSQAGLTLIGTNTSAAGIDTGTVKDLTIVPYLIGASSGSGVGSNFVTYDTTSGLRRLGNTEQSLVTAGATGENVRTSAGANAVTGAKVFNSLLLSSGGTGATPGTATSSVTGDGNSLTLTSGALANVATSATGNATVSGFSSIIFGTTGANEAVITNTNATAGGELTISSPINTFATGGGLTKTGGGTVILTVSPIYTGQTTVNQGSLQIGTGTVGDLVNYNGNIVLNGGTLSFGRTNTGLTIANAISGVGGVTQSGTGTTTLSVNNTYTGVTSLNAGVLVLGSANALPGGLGATGGTGGLTFNGGMLGLGSSDFLRNYNSVQGTAGTFAAPSNTGAWWAAYGADRQVIINNSAGTQQTFFNGKPINFGAADSTNMVTFVNGLNLTTVTRPVSATRGTTVGGIDGRFSGVIAETAGALAGLNKTGNGTLALTGANTFTGNVIINAGTVIANSLANSGSASPIGQGTYGITLNGGTFQYAPVASVGGAGHTTNRNFAISASSSIDASGAGALVFNAPTGNIISPDISTLAFTATGANTTMNLASSFPALAVGMTVTGPGVPANTKIASFSSTATTTTITLSATVTSTSGNANFGFATPRTLTLTGTNTNSNTLAGILQDSSATGAGVLSLTKAGVGSWTLSGANTYTGATNVTLGKLTVASTGTINGTSGVSIGAGEFNYNSSSALTQGVSFSSTGGKLSGSGTITPAVTVTSGNTLAPGNSIGTLSFGTGLTLAGTYSAELGTPGATPAAGVSDLAAVTGNLGVGGNLTLVNNANANGQGSMGAGAYQLATYTGNLSGTFGSVTNPLSSTLHEKVIYGPVSGGGSVDLELYRLATASITSPVALDNVRVNGTFGTTGLNVQNSAAVTFSEGLDATAGAVTGSATVGGTAITNLTGGSSSSTITVGLGNADTTTVGLKTGTVAIGLASNGSTTSGFGTTALTGQIVTVNGGVYDLANPTYSGATLALGNVRVGVGSNFSIANTTITNASFQDSLDVVATNGGNSLLTVTNPASIAAGTSGNVAYTANGAGSFAATSSLGFTSNANGVSGLTNIPLTAGSLDITGNGYDFARGTYTGTALALGNVRTGDTAPTANLGLTNTTVTSASFQDNLTASATTGNTKVTATGFTELAAGTADNLVFTGSTTTAGSLASTATLALTSTTAVSGLGDSSITPIGGAVTTTGGVYDFANAKYSGATLDFGNVHVGATVTPMTVAIGNQTITSAGFQDSLDVSATTDSGLVTATGFTGLAASTGGATTNNLSFGVSTATLGSLASTATLTLTSNANGIIGLSNGTATVVGSPTAITTTGNVYSGLSSWTTDGSGTWGTYTSNFGTNWNAGGTPGVDVAFTATDTATFGNALTTGTANVTLDGALVSLKSITFDNSNGVSYSVDKGTGSGTLSLDNGASDATITNDNGTHFITTDLVLTGTGVEVGGDSSGTTTLSGSISGLGKTLAKSGTSTLVLSGVNTYSGDTILNVGVLTLSGSGSLGSGSYAGAIINNATFNFDSSANQVLSGDISGSGALNKTGTGTLTLSGNNTGWSGSSILSTGTTVAGNANGFGTGIITLTAGATLNLNSLALPNTIINQGGTISGADTYTGPQTLSGSSAYSGTVASTLDVNRSGIILGNATFTGAVTINSGGIAKGTGNFSGGLIINSGGTLSPGNSPGITSAGNTVWNGGGNYIWEVNNATGTAAGGNLDLLTITGTLDMTGSTPSNKFVLKVTSLQLVDNMPGLADNFNAGSPGHTWTIVSTSVGITNFDANAIQIDLTGFTNSHLGSQFWSVATANGGLDINLVYVPEPSTYAALAGLAVLGLAWKRRRQNKL